MKNLHHELFLFKPFIENVYISGVTTWIIGKSGFEIYPWPNYKPKICI